MKLPTASHAAGPIACHVTEHAVRLLQLDWSGNRSTTVRWSMSRLVEGATGWEVCQAIAKALKDCAFLGTEAVTCLPRHVPCYRHLHLAPMPDDEVPAAIRFRLAKELQWQVNQFTSAHYEIASAGPNPHQHRDVLAVAASLEATLRHTRMLQESGLTPIAIDDEAAALSRCLVAHSSRQAASEPCLLLAVGTAHSMLVTLHRGQPTFVRMVKTKWNQDVAAEADSSTLAPLAQTLAHEFERCMHYFADNLPARPEPLRGVILGMGPSERAFAEQLSTLTGIRFAPLHESLPRTVRQICSFAQDRTTIDAWLPSIGMAAYGVEETALGAAA